MRLDAPQTEAVEFLREWAHAGFPKRADQSFPTDFLVAMKRVMDLPEGFSVRRLEDALVACPDGDHGLPRHRQWTSADVRATREYLA